MLYLDKIIKENEDILFINRSPNYVTLESIIEELENNNVNSTKYLWCKLIENNWNSNILHL